MERRSYGLSDVGRRRALNEDSYLADDELGVYVVADGVGGHAKGEVASAQTVEEVYGYVARNVDAIDEYVAAPDEAKRYQIRRLFESAVQSACYMVFGMAEQDPNQRGMSTTISGLLIAGPLAVVAQVGDSRVYRLRNRTAVQLTEDHTLLNYKLKHGLLTPEEARTGAGRNVITRAVGHRDYVQVDTLVTDVQVGDRYMLCSDGLHGYLDDAEVAPLLLRGDLEIVARILIELANSRGGKDNITALLVDIVAR